MKFRTEVFWVTSLAACLFLVKTSPVSSKEIILKGHDQFLYAQTIMERGDYGLAIGEFERFIHFFPDDPQITMARYLIAVCYLKDQNHEKAREVLLEILGEHSNLPLAGKALFLMGESFYQQNAFNQAEYYFKGVIENHSFLDLHNTALYRLAWIRMKENRWQQASGIFKKIGRGSPLYARSQQLSELALKGEDLPSKNPSGAGVLAALTPGLGHAYVSRYKDAAVAFFLNGLFIWAAIESFQQDCYVLGGILTFFEVGWYSGNIYSAVNCAHKYNRKVRNEFRNGLGDRLNLHLFAAGKRKVGLALAVHF